MPNTFEPISEGILKIMSKLSYKDIEEYSTMPNKRYLLRFKQSGNMSRTIF